MILSLLALSKVSGALVILDNGYLLYVVIADPRFTFTFDKSMEKEISLIDYLGFGVC
jgi:hypothetical protein